MQKHFKQDKARDSKNFGVNIAAMRSFRNVFLINISLERELAETKT